MYKIEIGGGVVVAALNLHKIKGYGANTQFTDGRPDGRIIISRFSLCSVYVRRELDVYKDISFHHFCE